MSQLRDPIRNASVAPNTLTSNEGASNGYSLSDHPLRHVLNNELHARPPVTLSPPETISHLATHSGDQGAGEPLATGLASQRLAAYPRRHHRRRSKAETCSGRRTGVLICNCC